MLRHDYILRLISQIARVVARMMGKMKTADPEEFENEIDSALKELSGLRFSLLDSLSLKSLLDILLTDGEIDPGRCLAIAELSALRAELDASEGHHDSAAQRRMMASVLYLEAFLIFRHESLNPAVARMEETLTKIKPYDLPEELLIRLFRFRAANGDFAAAEDALYEMLDRDIGGPKLRGEASRFYDQLLTLSDEELEAGRLPRVEVLEGLETIGTF